MPASATRLFIKQWKLLSRTCISTFIWRIIFCFLGPANSKARADMNYSAFQVALTIYYGCDENAEANQGNHRHLSTPRLEVEAHPIAPGDARRNQPSRARTFERSEICRCRIRCALVCSALARRARSLGIAAASR